ncbi:protein ORF44 [Cyprinid herpesvirus 1]|uniref:Protein ORF44 n=1 Tax=Cyprinid herpesvirus 1 TaxID=317858 RepID=K7PBN2_9VIRU|nr:protein ORF44 [Cyprinid herpesvirus 1]AFJ20456.1 protein ORF44 [Cyprinid herpesvirus 1]
MSAHSQALLKSITADISQTDTMLEILETDSAMSMEHVQDLQMEVSKLLRAVEVFSSISAQLETVSQEKKKKRSRPLQRTGPINLKLVREKWEEEKMAKAMLTRQRMTLLYRLAWDLSEMEASMVANMRQTARLLRTMTQTFHSLRETADSVRQKLLPART